MPNTLAHLGVQAIATRAVLRQADLKWVYLGCILPDAPWILHRTVTLVVTDAWYYDARLYAIVQSSLFACLLLSGALAVFSARAWRIFGLLALSCLFHLLLDATQTKWANGVHLFAPVSWQLLNFGWYWTESPVTLLLTTFGLGFVVVMWWRAPSRCDDLRLPRGPALTLGGACLLAYLLLPVALISGPEAADNHSVKTLRERDHRAGQEVELERRRYVRRDGKDVLIAFAGEEFILEGLGDVPPGIVSIKGRFLDAQTIRVQDAHAHFGNLRDLPSYVGLALVCLIWLWGFRLTLRR